MPLGERFLHTCQNRDRRSRRQSCDKRYCIYKHQIYNWNIKKSALTGGGPDQSPIPSGGSSADFNANIQQKGTAVKPVDMPMLTAEERETGIIRQTKNTAGQSQTAEQKTEKEISPHRGRGGTDVPAFSLVDGADSKYSIVQKDQSVKPDPLRPAAPWDG